MAKQLKKPWASAILNFILYGLGYVYNGKRVGFGAGLIIVGMLDYFLLSPFVSSSIEWGLMFLMTILFSFLFAYDGYKEAEEVNQGK